jgi:CheY-like chemotaxis protein
MSAHPSPLRVFVVDDNEDFLALARDWIASEPRLALVGCAREGLEALEEVARTKPDVVLVDVVMPGIDGFETTRRLKLWASAPRVIVMSFLDSDSVRRTAADAGADGFLSKTELTDWLSSALALPA